MAYFASSEDWKLTGPSRSQRREPLSIFPIPGMATRISSRKLNPNSPPQTQGFRSAR